MAPIAGELGMVLIVMMIFVYPATAQTGCTRTLVGLSPCLNYVTGNSSTPSTPCCSQLATVVQSQPQCLCVLLNGNASSLGLSINQTLALQLPGVCNVKTPPVSSCNGVNGPAASPAMSPPEDSSNQTPEAQDDPSIPRSGSKTVPATTTSSTNRLGTQIPLILFVIFITSSAASVIHF